MSIERTSFIENLRVIFLKNELGEYLNADVEDKFFALTVRMLEENEKYNLTAITEECDIILNHYVDCVKIAKNITRGASIIDIGCGAGFPSLPLAIVRDDIKILSVDSTAKRINYVKESASLLGLSNIECEVMRAEDGGKNPKLREKFDFATARAVANMRVLCELCLPFVKSNGYMIAMKGKNAKTELDEAMRAIKLLGGESCGIEWIRLVSYDGEIFEHPLINIKKTKATPKEYPRSYAKISKMPL